MVGLPKKMRHTLYDDFCDSRESLQNFGNPIYTMRYDATSCARTDTKTIFTTMDANMPKGLAPNEHMTGEFGTQVVVSWR